MKLAVPKKKMKKVGEVLEKIIQKIFVAMKVDLFLVLFLPFLPGMLIGVDNRVGFRHAINNEE